MQLTLDADVASDIPGYTLEITAASGRTELTVALRSGERLLAERVVTVAGESCEVEFARQGGYLVAMIGDECAFREKVN